MRKIWYMALCMVVVGTCGCSDDSGNSSIGDQENQQGGEGQGTGGEGQGTGGEGQGTGGEGQGTGGEGQGTGGEGGKPSTEAPCTSHEACPEGLFCKDGECVHRVDVGDACDKSHDCYGGTCDEDGICRKYVGENVPCDGDNVRCAGELNCMTVPDTNDPQKYCFVTVDLGEYCNNNELFCREGYECNMLALQCAERVALGESCDRTTRVCAEGICLGGKCVEPVNDDCDDDIHPCSSPTATCYDGKCIETHGCESDSDCLADTYCCTEDACLVKNVCLPYGEGPREKTNDQCLYKTEPGLFEADLQCDWTVPETGDPYPKSYNIVTPTFVAKTPHNMGTSNALIVATYIAGDWSNGDEAYKYGVIRIINPETCKVVENIYDEQNYVSAGATMAIADVDNDGFVEIYAQRSPYQPKNSKVPAGGIVQFVWDKDQGKYVTGWVASSTLKQRAYGWGGLAVHDINNDGVPEIINPYGEVLDAVTGTKLNGTQVIDNPLFATIGDLDNDGKAEYIARSGDVHEWVVVRNEAGEITSQSWVLEYPKAAEGGGYTLKAIGDFGTPGETAADFDWDTKDGIAEIVSTQGIDKGRGSSIAIHALTSKVGTDGKVTKGQQRIFYLTGLFGGGAPTIGDFDRDGMPEVGIAFGDYYSVFDPRCKKDGDGVLPEGCLEENYLWKQPNTDNSSYCTGSSVFDFDGDGQIEVVYADECYTRIYDGKTGDVLFSAKHSSRTAYEMPTIADVDNDESAEIIMGANTTDRTCDTIDKIHRGIRCTTNQDCTSGICEDKFCRCSIDNDCNWRKGSDNTLKEEYICTDPLADDKAINPNKVCRAKRPQKKTISGVRVMRDRYDRWASARNIWNQFPYSISNINDNLTVPNLADWVQNFLNPSLNNYRANAQGKIGMNAAPDITGKLDKEHLCVKSSGTDKITLHGMICNRGTKMVASQMPASFYRVNDDGSLGTKFCTAYTASNVPVGGCLEVSCGLEKDEIEMDIRIRMVSNDNGEGGRTTVECNSDNNTDEVVLESCPIF